MPNPADLRNETLAVLLDRRDALQAALEETDEDQAKAVTVEIRRVRDLLSRYCGRSDPSRDMFTSEQLPLRSLPYSHPTP